MRKLFLVFLGGILMQAQTPEEHYQMGLKEMELNHFGRAIVHFDDAIKKDPNHLASYEKRGVCKAELGQYMESIKDLTFFLKNTPSGNHWEAYNSRGKSKNGLRDYKGGLKDLEMANKLNPNNPKILNNIGISYTGMGKYVKAIQMFNKAIELSPENGLYVFNRAVTYFRQGSSKKACAEWSKSGEMGIKESYDMIQQHCMKE